MMKKVIRWFIVISFIFFLGFYLYNLSLEEDTQAGEEGMKNLAFQVTPSTQEESKEENAFENITPTDTNTKIPKPSNTPQNQASADVEAGQGKTIKKTTVPHISAEPIKMKPTPPTTPTTIKES